MLNYLLQHAVDNVWCSPEQDRQSIIKPKRLSHRLGTFSFQKVMWEKVALPTKSDYYHVFQIGHINPKLLGLTPVGSTWMTLSEVINTTTLMAEVYLASGIIFPRGECWLRFDNHKNLILAIEDNERLFPQLRNEEIYLRVYSNAYFESTRSDIQIDKTVIEGLTVSSQTDVLNLQRKYHDAKLLPGSAFAYLNGLLIDDLIPSKINLGDKIEYVYDSSVYRVLDFDIKDLTTFVSILDSESKFLLNYDEDDNGRIDFEDDIDIYLIKKDQQSKYKGVYYHRNKFNSIRMVSHKDYSIPVGFIQSFLDTYNGTIENVWDDMNDLTIRLYIRKSGFDRPLIQEHSRLFELYRLDPEDVRNALQGMHANVDVWKAENLENSPYVALMRSRKNNLDLTQIQDAYGYNAISKLVGDTPSKPILVNGSPEVELPPIYRTESTMYEYDKDGLLLGYYTHTVGLIYNCIHPETKLVEIVAGLASEELDSTFNQLEVITDSKYNYRAYLSTRFGDNLLWDWMDVSNTEIISVGDNKITFGIDPTIDYPAVISDKKFIAYTLYMDEELNNGVMKFSISSYETHLGIRERHLSTIAPRRVDVWLNNHSLIENLDYYVKWPEIVVVNKKYLIPGQDQKIDIRALGFCQDDMTIESQREFGYVEHGYLSADRKYNVRDDKVLSIVVDGKLVSRDLLTFAEDSTGVSIPGIPNGVPYSVRETIVPMRGETYLDTYLFRNRSIEVDKQIEAYMTVKYPEPTIPEISPITERYAVYSPFISHLIYDLQEGIIDEEPLSKHYSNAKAIEWVERYRYLLDYDPVIKGVDPDYVSIHPHQYSTTVQLTIYQFTFLKRINELLLDNKVSMNQFIEVTLPQTQE